MSGSWLSINALCAILLMAPYAAANEQPKNVGTLAKADNKIAVAPHELGHQVKQVQLEAHRRIATANDNFMQVREEYRQATQTNLTVLDRRVAELETKAKKGAGKARAALHARIKQIQARRDSFASSFNSIETAAAVTWDEMKARMDKEWVELMFLVDNR